MACAAAIFSSFIGLCFAAALAAFGDTTLLGVALGYGAAAFTVFWLTLFWHGLFVAPVETTQVD